MWVEKELSMNKGTKEIETHTVQEMVWKKASYAAVMHRTSRTLSLCCKEQGQMASTRTAKNTILPTNEQYICIYMFTRLKSSSAQSGGSGTLPHTPFQGVSMCYLVTI